MASEYVYVVTNEAFDGWCKIGLTTKAPAKRLNQYQTGCPKRAYKMPYVQPIDDSKALEREIHLNLRDMGIDGSHEWFLIPEALAISMVSTAVHDLE
jgi:hypothetical protein